METYDNSLDRIDRNSSMPRYKQVVRNILEDIAKHKFKAGDKIPSINETSEEYYLSRDTVEKAYRELSRRGVLFSVPGKGYYIKSVDKVCISKVLFLVDKLSSPNLQLYKAFLKNAGEQIQISLYSYEEEPDKIIRLVSDYEGSFDHYLLSFPALQYLDRWKIAIRQIPENKRLIIDTYSDKNWGELSVVKIDWAKSFKPIFEELVSHAANYDNLYWACPPGRENYMLRSILENFCRREGINFTVQPPNHESITSKNIHVGLDRGCLPSHVQHYTTSIGTQDQYYATIESMPCIAINYSYLAKYCIGLINKENHIKWDDRLVLEIK